MKMKNKTVVLIATVACVLLLIAGTKMFRKAGMANGLSLDIVPVTVAKVSMQSMDEKLSLTGTLLANKDVDIISETQGTVVSVNIQVGDFKNVQDILFRLDDEVKQANYSSAEVDYLNAKAEVERQIKLAQEGLISTAQLETAKLSYQSSEARYITARRQYNDAKIKTPISGIVTSRAVDIGNLVTAGMKVANIVDIRTLKVSVNVPENDYFKVRVGDSVSISIDLYPGISFPGRVTSKSVKADDAHTYPVEIKLHNSDKHPLYAGLFCRVLFVSNRLHPAIMVPRTALIGSVYQPKVFVVKNGSAILRPVVTGSEVGSNIEIVSGLNVDETIVIAGQSVMADSTQVKIIE
jgi:RND family efflux transporter MFP subunit